MLFIFIFNTFFSFLYAGLFGKFLGFKGIRIFSTSCLLLNILSLFFIVFFGKLIPFHITIDLGNWVASGSLNIAWSFAIDDFILTMLIVVNLISTIVHYYSINYMSEDAHIIRFVSYLSLFTFFMNILITSDNFIVLFLGWEGVGLCSFLLISFWFTRVQANKSALKAIIVNRISDFSLTFGIVLIFYYTITVDFESIFALIPFYNTIIFSFFNNGVTFYLLTIITVSLYVGAVGKSAQIFLHTWLPDAMEGPTPVSALIHAATMVTAGVFLLIKCSWIFELSTKTLLIIGFSGAITSVFAASSGLLLSDIKKIIAYSTCSQLGYMIFICGLSNYSVGLFHLANHAIFKALLFLCAGAVIHSVSNEQDVRRMGGLLKILPLSYSTLLIASLAITGFPFLTGFYSKDIILETVSGLFGINAMFISWLGITTAFFTACYSVRIIFLGFLTTTNLMRKHVLNLHESPKLMGFSLFFLAIGSIFFGFNLKDCLIGPGTLFLSNSYFIDFQNYNNLDSEYINVWLKNLPLLFTFLGIFLYFIVNFFGFKFIYFYLFSFNFLSFFLINKWHFDKIYNNYFNKNFLIFSKKNVYKNIDKGLLEIIGPFGILKFFTQIKFFYSHFQKGNIADYLFIIVYFTIIFIYI